MSQLADQQQAGQPAVEPAAPAAGAQPVQGTPSNAPATGAQPVEATDYKALYEQMEARFKGMQRLQTQTAQELNAARAELGTQAEHATAMEQQLSQTQDIAAQATRDLAARDTQLAAVSAEAAFLGLVQQEYPDLVQIAPSLQRRGSLDEQRALLDGVRQALGTQVAAAATRQVAETFAGATPGAGPTAGSSTPGQYSREEIMEHVMDEGLMRHNPAEYQTWYERYQNSPEMGFASLGRGDFQDPFASDWQTMQRAAGQQVSLTQRHPTQAFEQNAADQGFGQSPGMPGAFGGPLPPGQG